MKKLTVLRDTREQKGWQFNKSSWCHGTEETGLKTGDYAIKEAPQLLCVERKANVSEVCSNFLMTRDRFYREVERMQDFKHRFLILEFTLNEIFYSINYRFFKNQGMKYDAPNILLGSITSLQLKYGVNVVFAGSKGKEYTSKLMRKCYEYYTKEIKNGS